MPETLLDRAERAFWAKCCELNGVDESEIYEPAERDRDEFRQCMAAALASLQPSVSEMRLGEALRPFVEAYEAKFDRYVRANSNWHHEMPGEWPIELMLTVADCRKARSALSPEGEP